MLEVTTLSSKFEFDGKAIFERQFPNLIFFQKRILKSVQFYLEKSLKFSNLKLLEEL